MFPLTKYALSVTLCCCLNANASLAILQSFPFLYNCTATQYTCSSLIGQLYGLIHSLSDWLYLLWEPHSHTLSDSVIVKTLNWSIRSWQLLTQWLSIHHVILHKHHPTPHTQCIHDHSWKFKCEDIQCSEKPADVSGRGWAAMCSICVGREEGGRETTALAPVTLYS